MLSPAAQQCGSSRHDVMAVALVAFFALVVRLVVWHEFPVMYHADEIYQTVEQAHHLAFGTGITPWEFEQGARSWLLPVLLAGAMKVGALFDGSTESYLTAAKFLLALVSLIPVVCAYLWCRRLGRSMSSAMLAALACGIWYELVFFSVSSLSEAIAAHLLVLAFYLGDGAFRTTDSNLHDRRGKSVAFATGSALGLAIAIRPHLFPAALIVPLFANRKMWTQILLGGAMVGVLAGLVDWAFWGTPFHSYLIYYQVNISNGVADSFGVFPWYSYFEWLVENWSWRLPIIALLTLVGARVKPQLLLAAAAIVLSHSLIGHKEFRFIYPALVMNCVCATIGLAEVTSWVGSRLTGHARSRHARFAVFALAIAGWTSISIAGALDRHFAPYWKVRSGLIAAYRTLRDNPRTCGVALIGTNVWQTPGYSYLHRDIPVQVFADGAQFELRKDQVNDLVVVGPPPFALEGFERGQCWMSGIPGHDWDACIFTRSGTCEVTSNANRIGNKEPWWPTPFTGLLGR